jgi:hypothetical protein
MSAPRIIIVLLRRPGRHPEERRDDPFWEFGSFGCTGCHHSNLLNPKRSSELKGTRLAFVQGGDGGFRLIHVTPQISVRDLADICEAVWEPAKMPLTYATAPVVVDNQGHSDIPLLAEMAHGVKRTTPVGRFSSAFRSCRRPLAGEVGAEVLDTYRKFRRDAAEIATRYDQAMPYSPPRIEQDRLRRYELIRSRSKRAAKKATGTVRNCRGKNC